MPVSKDSDIIVPAQFIADTHRHIEVQSLSSVHYALIDLVSLIFINSHHCICDRNVVCNNQRFISNQWNNGAYLRTVAHNMEYDYSAMLELVWFGFFPLFFEKMEKDEAYFEIAVEAITRSLTKPNQQKFTILLSIHFWCSFHMWVIPFPSLLRCLRMSFELGQINISDSSLHTYNCCGFIFLDKLIILEPLERYWD